MSVLRKNTLVVDLSVLPKRPDAGKVQEFLEKKVKLQLEDTKTIQLHNLKNCVYVETIDLETALQYEKKNNYQHTIVCHNKEFKIPVYVESEAVTVRVHDLPSHTDHLTIINFMKQFGSVMSISRERWKHYFPGHYNGARVLRMRLSRSIPSTVVINGDATLITYRGQPKTCHHCGKAVHPKQKCTTVSANTSNSKTPLQPAPGGSSGQQNGHDFPLLSPPSEDDEPNKALNSTAPKENEKIKTKRDENNTASEHGDDFGKDSDYEEEDDDNGSSDNNEFIEPVNQKRRLSQKVQNENEKKKVCMNQGSQDLTQNRFQPLIIRN